VAGRRRARPWFSQRSQPATVAEFTTGKIDTPRGARYAYGFFDEQVRLTLIVHVS